MDERGCSKGKNEADIQSGCQRHITGFRGTDSRVCRVPLRDPAWYDWARERSRLIVPVDSDRLWERIARTPYDCTAPDDCKGAAGIRTPYNSCPPYNSVPIHDDVRTPNHGRAPD